MFLAVQWRPNVAGVTACREERKARIFLALGGVATSLYAAEHGAYSVEAHRLELGANRRLARSGARSGAASTPVFHQANYDP